MTDMDAEALVRNGDIVWQMPCEWVFNVTKPDGELEKHTMSNKEKGLPWRPFFWTLSVGKRAPRVS